MPDCTARGPAREVHQMTLVVACVTPDIGFLVADTLLSVEFELKGHVGPVDGKFHALKIQILNGDIAVAFAGDAEASFNLIKNLQVELSADPKMDVASHLFESYKQLIANAPQQPPDCEFLVLRLTPEGRTLAHVTKVDVADCERAYIGHPADYRRLMELKRPHHPPKTQQVQQPDGTFRTVPLITSDGEREFAELSDAMERLTGERKSNAVGAIGNLVTRVVDARISGKLEYLQLGEASISPAEGGSGFSYLASNSNTRGIAIYYKSGKMGFLFVVGDSEPCRQESAETLSQFIETAKAKYGLDLSGVTWKD
jgi:hypothetical protein